MSHANARITITAIGKIALCALSICLPCAPALAADDGMNLAHIALAAKQQNATPAWPWISHMRVSDNSTRSIKMADGKTVLERPRIVRSYSESVRYDVSRFYAPDRLQVNTIMHYAGRRAGEIISFGFDSGFSAEKLTVAPALFAGYTRAFRVAKATHITIGLGGWFGGKVSQKSCRDSVDREYYCPTLTAWSDYRQPRHQLHQYYHLVWTRDF